MGKETLTIIKASLHNEVQKKAKPKHLKLGKLEFKATVEVDSSAAKELDTDARFVAKLYDDATQKYKECVNKIALLVVRADDLAGVAPLTKEELKDLDKEINSTFEASRKEIVAVVTKHFDKWKQANKDRKKYRIKVVGAIVVGSGCAIASTASLAAGAVTGGASIAASIYGIAQSVVSVGRAIKKISSDITKVHKDLDKALKELVKNYETKSKASVKAREIGKEFVADFLMIEMAGFNRVDKHLETYKAKLKNLDLESAKLGKDLNKLLDQQSKLDKEIDRKFQKTMKNRNYKSKKLTGMFDSMETCRKSSAKLIQDIEVWHHTLKPAEKFRDDCDKAVAALRHKDPTWAKWAIWIASLGLSTGVSTIASGGDNLVKAADGLQKGFNALQAELT